MELFEDSLNLNLYKTLEQKPKEIQRENLNLRLLYLGKFSTREGDFAMTFVSQWFCNKHHLQHHIEDFLDQWQCHLRTEGPLAHPKFLKKIIFFLEIS